MYILIASFVIFVALLFLYQFFKLRRVVNQRQSPSDSSANLELRTELSFDNDTITAKYPDGNSISIKWAELSMVGIALISKQANSSYIYWGLHAGKRTPAITYPHDAIGDKTLLAEFGKRLPNFDMGKVMDIISSSGTGQFTVWQMT